MLSLCIYFNWLQGQIISSACSSAVGWKMTQSPCPPPKVNCYRELSQVKQAFVPCSGRRKAQQNGFVFQKHIRSILGPVVRFVGHWPKQPDKAINKARASFGLSEESLCRFYWNLLSFPRSLYIFKWKSTLSSNYSTRSYQQCLCWFSQPMLGSSVPQHARSWSRQSQVKVCLTTPWFIVDFWPLPSCAHPILFIVPILQLSVMSVSSFSIIKPPSSPTLELPLVSFSHFPKSCLCCTSLAAVRSLRDWRDSHLPWWHTSRQLNNTIECRYKHASGINEKQFHLNDWGNRQRAIGYWKASSHRSQWEQLLTITHVPIFLLWGRACPSGVRGELYVVVSVGTGPPRQCKASR